MSYNVPQVFISSTSEFAAERKQLQQALSTIPGFDFKPYIYEEEAAGPHSPEAHLQKVLDDSEIVVLILGSKYGSDFPGRPISIVEWEYEYAKEASKELKSYVSHAPAADPRQAKFIARVREFRGGSWCRLFRDPSELVKHVIDDVKAWRLQSWQLLRELSGERRKWKDRVVIGGCVVVAIGTLAGLITGALMGVPAPTLAVILGGGVAMLAGLGWLLKTDVV